PSNELIGAMALAGRSALERRHSAAPAPKGSLEDRIMIKPLISAALIGLCAVAWAADDSRAIEGIWETESGGYVQIYQQGDVWNGRVVGSRDGEARYDENNPDEAQRDRRLLGVVVLKGL